MKGVIFTLTEEVVRAAHGEDAWDAVLDGAGLDGSWTTLGSYPDESFTKVVTSASALLGVDEPTVLRTVAEGAMPLLAARYPHFFDQHADACAFALTLNEVIHPEVRKLYPGATPPSFGVQRTGELSLDMRYVSERHLCALAEGFLVGAATHYGQTVTLAQSSCLLLGDDHCLIHCQFANAS
ncbi:MAG: heme NO-binding domain-containing protein [Actinomycetota bacterium]|nr:heme NO-binding domain-containing protein [Actinomycetota bacterium]